LEERNSLQVINRCAEILDEQVINLIDQVKMW
jgi:hypothetical protein